MKVLIVIDAQNEFSEKGKRPVPDFHKASLAIKKRVTEARQAKAPIAWVRHFNRPHESKAFVPHTWGHEYAEGFGPLSGYLLEKEFHKNVYGAFTGSDLGEWIEKLNAHSVLVVGFYTHGCVSTTSREAIMKDLDVYLDPDATATCDMHHDLLGSLSTDQLKHAALLHLANMGAHIERLNGNADF